MPAFSQSLEASLHRALEYANERNHEYATLEHLPQVVADMVRLQRLIGARPAEMCIMRPCDIDRSSEVWVCTCETQDRAPQEAAANLHRAEGPGGPPPVPAARRQHQLLLAGADRSRDRAGHEQEPIEARTAS